MCQGTMFLYTTTALGIVHFCKEVNITQRFESIKYFTTFPRTEFDRAFVAPVKIN